jgi:hypothetical protein
LRHHQYLAANILNGQIRFAFRIRKDAEVFIFSTILATCSLVSLCPMPSRANSNIASADAVHDLSVHLDGSVGYSLYDHSHFLISFQKNSTPVYPTPPARTGKRAAVAFWLLPAMLFSVDYN